MRCLIQRRVGQLRIVVLGDATVNAFDAVVVLSGLVGAKHEVGRGHQLFLQRSDGVEERTFFVQQTGDVQLGLGQAGL